MKIELVAIEKIKPARYNPRVDLKPGDPEYEAIKRSISEFSLVEPLVWNKHNGVLVGGHQRLKVLRELGHAKIPVSVVEIKDVAREKALNVALNKIAGEFLPEKLSKILEEITASNAELIAATGFSDEELKKLAASGAGPVEFEKFGVDLHTTFTCPKCGYESDGKSKKKDVRKK